MTRVNSASPNALWACIANVWNDERNKCAEDSKIIATDSNFHPSFICQQNQHMWPRYVLDMYVTEEESVDSVGSAFIRIRLRKSSRIEYSVRVRVHSFGNEWFLIHCRINHFTKWPISCTDSTENIYCFYDRNDRIAYSVHHSKRKEQITNSVNSNYDVDLVSCMEFSNAMAIVQSTAYIHRIARAWPVLRYFSRSFASFFFLFLQFRSWHESA